jgi:hypothetical protein
MCCCICLPVLSNKLFWSSLFFLVDAESTETKSKHNDNLIRITQKCKPDFFFFVLTSMMCSFENIGEIKH